MTTNNAACAWALLLLLATSVAAPVALADRSADETLDDIEKAAASVEGVSAVHNHIGIKG